MKRFGLLRKTRVRPISRVREARLKEYEKLRAEWLVENTKCAICNREGKIEVHHRNGRLGSLLTATEFWVPLHPICHRQVHANPRWAMAKGLLGGPGEWNNTKLTKGKTV